MYGICNFGKMTARAGTLVKFAAVTLDRTLVRNRESHLQGGNVTGSCKLCLIGVLLATARLTAQNSPTGPVSELQFESSDAKLVQVFQWSKSQALAYAHDGSDPVGPWSD